MTREEAIKILEEEAEFLYGGDEPYNRMAFDMAIEALQADAVKVVRCKDCRWYKKIVEKSKSGLCHYDLVARCLHDEGFCSHGERSEE